MRKEPGCFGISIVFDIQSETCIKCSHNRNCASRSCESLLEIHKTTDVTDFLEGIKRSGLDVDISLSSNEMPRQTTGKKKIKKNKVPIMKLDLIASMPKCASELATKMLKIEPLLKEAINQGRNPFCGVKPAYLEPVFDIVMTGVFRKQEIVNALRATNSSWTDSTVRSHYHSIINALVALDIIISSGKYFELRGQK